MIYRIINKIGRLSPDFIGRLIVNIPFSFRFGNEYVKFKKIAQDSEKWNEKELENYIVSSFDKAFQYAKKFKFYRDKYEKSGVLNLKVENIEDIKKIPILTRKEVQENISQFDGHSLQQTSGTSGNPLPLYLDKNAWSREWAFYHSIWKRVGYKHTHAKFVFRKQKLKEAPIKYDFGHNEYIVQNYNMNSDQIDDFFKTLTSRNVKYFHGYPSAINDFLKDIEGKITDEQKRIVQEQIKCCFYASETPLPHFVNYLRNQWNLNYISMYGHTEMCLLAATNINELDHTVYHTYGYAEVDDNRLLGTSYHNFDMPLIRYDSNDLVRAKRFKNGIVKSFEIKEGRVFDFIYDKNDSPISVTALFREKHHKIFNDINYIQVFQEKKGQATILITLNKGVNLEVSSLTEHLENLNIDFDFIYLNEPVRTNAGKVPLRVKNMPK